jgi:hypothetical protein
LQGSCEASFSLGAEEKAKLLLLLLQWCLSGLGFLVYITRDGEAIEQLN